MTLVTVRPMTEAEYQSWSRKTAEDFATEQVATGAWMPEGAVEKAMEENAGLLPHGLATPRMLILQGVDELGQPIGYAWVGLDHPRGTPDTGFIYDIEINEDRRGEGLGRALLLALEREVQHAGVSAIELNVFGRNRTAVSLYESAGYAVTTQQMRKSFDG